MKSERQTTCYFVQQTNVIYIFIEIIKEKRSIKTSFYVEPPSQENYLTHLIGLTLNYYYCGGTFWFYSFFCCHRKSWSVGTILWTKLSPFVFIVYMQMIEMENWSQLTICIWLVATFILVEQVGCLEIGKLAEVSYLGQC
jgi:hypothetical protein